MPTVSVLLCLRKLPVPTVPVLLCLRQLPVPTVSVLRTLPAPTACANCFLLRSCSCLKARSQGVRLAAKDLVSTCRQGFGLNLVPTVPVFADFFCCLHSHFASQFCLPFFAFPSAPPCRMVTETIIALRTTTLPRPLTHQTPKTRPRRSGTTTS